MNFKYSKKEIECLKSRDRRLGEVIDRIGQIRWAGLYFWKVSGGAIPGLTDPGAKSNNAKM